MRALWLPGLIVLAAAPARPPEQETRAIVGDFCLAVVKNDRRTAFRLADLTSADGGASQIKRVMLETMLLDSKRLNDIAHLKGCDLLDEMEDTCDEVKARGQFDGGCVGVPGRGECMPVKKMGAVWRVVLETTEATEGMTADGGTWSLLPPPTWKQDREVEWARVTALAKDAGVSDCNKLKCLLRDEEMANLTCEP